jgi:hypothetical protein
MNMGWSKDERASMNSEELSCEAKAEIMRKKSRYRELILSGKLVLPYQRAAQLLGPDCLYHLYSVKAHAAVDAASRRVSETVIRTRRDAASTFHNHG